MYILSITSVFSCFLAGFCIWWWWPVTAVGDEFGVLVLNRQGKILRRIGDFPGIVSGVIPIGKGWLGQARYLVGLTEKGFPYTPNESFPERMVEINLFSGRKQRFVPGPQTIWGSGPPHGIPRFDRSMLVEGIRRSPIDAPNGVARFVAVWQHPVHFPSLAAGLTADGKTDWILPHPGRLSGDFRFFKWSGTLGPNKKMYCLAESTIPSGIDLF